MENTKMVKVGTPISSCCTQQYVHYRWEHASSKLNAICVNKSRINLTPVAWIKLCGIVFLVCSCLMLSSYSWGYRKVFEEYAQFIHQNFPKVRIEGDNYPPPRPRQMLASVLSLAKLAVMAIVLLGERLQIWESLNVDPPQVYIWATQNKVFKMFCI